MPNDTIRLDPATRFVRSLPGEYFLLREAAEAVGVSQFILRKFIADGTEGCMPSKFTMFGKVKIYLYTRDDIESIRQHLATRYRVFRHDGQARRVGRPPIYTKEERVNRSRLYSKSWYWRSREKILYSRNDFEGARKAKERAEEIDRILHDKN